MTKVDLRLPDINVRKFTNKLPILYSCRIRLTDEQRDILKKAWNQYRNQSIPAAKPPIPGSTISSATNFTGQGIGNLSAIVISDLIGSRDSIPLTTILNLAFNLGVEVIDRKDLEAAFAGYLDYVIDTSKHRND